MRVKCSIELEVDVDTDAKVDNLNNYGSLKRKHRRKSVLFYLYMLFIYMFEVSTWYSEFPRLFRSKLGSELRDRSSERSKLVVNSK